MLHLIRSTFIRLVDAPIRVIDRRITVHAVKRYHREQHRVFRLLAIEERDPRIAAWFEAQARAHHRFGT